MTLESIDAAQAHTEDATDLVEDITAHIEAETTHIVSVHHTQRMQHPT